MTSGKTLAGEALSEKTGRKLIDLDRYIEQQEGMDMESIFREKGEPYFRKREEECLKQIVETEDDIILSLGGGTGGAVLIVIPEQFMEAFEHVR